MSDFYETMDIQLKDVCIYDIRVDRGGVWTYVPGIEFNGESFDWH